MASFVYNLCLVACSNKWLSTGLSQRDLALSKRAEEQLEQERRDEELARRLQQQLDMEVPESEDQRFEAKTLLYSKLNLASCLVYSSLLAV